MLAPFPHMEMRNPFIVLRFVLFAILVYLNVLTLGFAAWNLSVLKALDVPVLGAPSFVVFNACLSLSLVVGTLAAPWLVRRPLDQVCYECMWTGVLSILQLASSFNLTVNGPPVLCQGLSITACASSSLTVALTWFSCMIVLLYAFSLLTSAITHMAVLPDIWTLSVRAVPWFIQPASISPLETHTAHPDMPSRESTLLDIKRQSFHFSTPIFEKHMTKTLPSSPLHPPTFPASPVSPVWSSRRSSLRPSCVPMERRTTWTSRLFSGAPTLTHKQSNDSFRPGWAQRISGGRRGVDLPFTMPRFSRTTAPPPPPPIRPLRPLKLKSYWSQSTISLKSPPPAIPVPVPAVPPQVKAKKARPSGPGALDDMLSTTSTFYIDLERDAVVPTMVADPRPISYGMFPEDVMDPDQPITRSRPSEWVRADSESGSTRSSLKGSSR